MFTSKSFACNLRKQSCTVEQPTTNGTNFLLTNDLIGIVGKLLLLVFIVKSIN
jgi:hypothetical protein